MSAPGHSTASHERVGVVLALVSAAAFGVLAVLVKVAADEGADSVSVLAMRFIITAPLLWIIAARLWKRRPRRRLVPSGRAAVGGLALGLVGYSAQAGAVRRGRRAHRCRTRGPHALRLPGDGRDRGVAAGA